MEVHDEDVTSTVRRSRRAQRLGRRMCTIDCKDEGDSRGAPLFRRQRGICWSWRIGWRRKGSRTLQWRPPASTGSRSGTSWRAGLSWCSRMLRTFAMFPVARATSTTQCGFSDLLAHGLIRASFVPPAQIQDVRDLTRTRTQLAREVAQHIQRIQKTFENANIKSTSVISNIIGTTGRRILKAMIASEANPGKLAA